MKKNRHNKKNFDLGKVAGGLSLAGGISTGGDLQLVDQSRNIKKDEKNGTVTKKDTSVGIYIDADVAL